MTDGELRDLLVERLTRLEKAQGETNARLAEVVQVLKEHANIQLALRVGQQELIEKVGFLSHRIDHVADRVDRVTDRIERLTGQIIRGFTERDEALRASREQHDEQLRDLRARLERLEQRLGPENPPTS